MIDTTIAIYSLLPFADVEYVERIIYHACSLGLGVEMPRELINALPNSSREKVIEAEAPTPNCEMVLSLGGDGTFLRSAHRSLKGYPAPLAGINTGTLGFLATWEREDFQRILAMAAGGNVPIRLRTLLAMRCPQSGDKELLALNDISLLRSQSSQMITVSATLGSTPLTDYTGDGLIVCTATGSTGYNLSAGGPILQPETNALVLTPVAPHTLTQRPLVISTGETLHLTVSGRSSCFLVSIDGESRELPCGTPIEIYRASRSLPIVFNETEDFATRLRAKLMWGENPVRR